MHCKFFSHLPILSCNVKVREYGKYFFEASQNKFEVAPCGKVQMHYANKGQCVKLLKWK